MNQLLKFESSITTLRKVNTSYLFLQVTFLCNINSEDVDTFLPVALQDNKERISIS